MTVRWPRLLTPTHLSQIIRKQKNPLTALQMFKEAKYKYPNYCHNGPVYATLIGILGNAGQICEMKEVIDWMKEDSCECKDSVFVNAIKTYARAGLVNEAVSLFKSIPQFNCVHRTESFNTLLQILINESKLEAAHRLFLENSYGWEVKYRIRIIELAHGCSVAGEDIEDTKRLINEALIRGGIPSLASYKSMAIDLYNEGKISEANKVLITMQERGFRPTNLIYETKVAALCRGGNVDAAVKVIEEEMEGNCVPNVRAYNILLKGLCNEGKSVIAVDYLKKMAKKLGCVADKETYGILINGLCRESRYLEASQVLQEMLIKSYWPCVDTYNILIRGLCSMSRQYEAVLWLEEMVSQGMKPELSVWNSLVASVCSNMADIEVCSQTCN
uniref:Pentacotripeptide-repeat region of PRORP domain-containing protein n=1 Tax=Fagus sylvatica TaxID=28930 RepID=A0A2N9HGD0_FAGSY